MGSTKIIVVQLKQLIKIALLALLGIFIIVMLVYFFVAKDKSVTGDNSYKPGTYTSSIKLNDGLVDVQVTVTKTKIASIELLNMAETQEVFYPLVKPTFETLAKEIIDMQSTDIAVSATSPITSGLLLKAVDDALLQACAE